MLSLILALSLSQADFSPPPLPSTEVVETPRSARLTSEPRVGAGALVGRTLMATTGGLVGVGLATGLLFGSVAIAGGGWTGLAVGLVFAAVMSPVAGALVVAGVAAGAALFGTNFGKDFRDALTVSGIAVPVAAAMVVALLLLGVTPFFALLPAVVATVVTPLIVQARKPELREQPGPARQPEPSPLTPAGGVTFAL